jgi:hypothetical protein
MFVSWGLDTEGGFVARIDHRLHNGIFERHRGSLLGSLVVSRGVGIFSARYVTEVAMKRMK